MTPLLRDGGPIDTAGTRWQLKQAEVRQEHYGSGQKAHWTDVPNEQHEDGAKGDYSERYWGIPMSAVQMWLHKRVIRQTPMRYG
jgi:hypothetical protein